MAMIAVCTILGKLMGDIDEGTSPYNHVASISIAVTGLWIMNFFTNVIQGPARALVNDLIHPDRTQLGNAIISGVMAIAAVLANIVGAQFVDSSNPYFTIFLIGVGFTLFSMIPTLAFGVEKKFERGVDQPPLSISGTFFSIFEAFKNMPRPLLKVAFVFLLSWMSWTPLMVNQTQFYIKNVYNEKYGLYMGMYSLALQSTVQASFSFLLPYIIDAIGLKLAYFFTQIVQAVCFLLIWLLPIVGIKHTTTTALLLTSIPAINFAAFNSIPFAMTTDIVGESNVGLYMGVLNSASVIAQTLITLGVSLPILSYFNLTWAIGTGSIFGFLTCIMIFFLDTSRMGSRLEIQETEPMVTSEF